MDKIFNIGDEIKIEESKVYGLHDTKSSYVIKTGIFYIYNDKIVNDRIRITDSKDKIGKPCMASGWVNVNDITPSNV